ncbi:MAG TPA: hypothetical protein VNP92_01870 [Actinophytocola sp.]|nr:hypothetical protein [Actinophytocola sp.]
MGGDVATADRAQPQHGWSRTGSEACRGRIGAHAAVRSRLRKAGGQHLQIRVILTEHAGKLGTELGSR